MGTVLHTTGNYIISCISLFVYHIENRCKQKK
jgi:hypothetical protein